MGVVWGGVVLFSNGIMGVVCGDVVGMVWCIGVLCGCFLLWGLVSVLSYAI